MGIRNGEWFVDAWMGLNGDSEWFGGDVVVVGSQWVMLWGCCLIFVRRIDEFFLTFLNKINWYLTHIHMCTKKN